MPFARKTWKYCSFSSIEHLFWDCFVKQAPRVVHKGREFCDKTSNLTLKIIVSNRNKNTRKWTRISACIQSKTRQLLLSYSLRPVEHLHTIYLRDQKRNEVIFFFFEGGSIFLNLAFHITFPTWQYNVNLINSITTT